KRFPISVATRAIQGPQSIRTTEIAFVADDWHSSRHCSPLGAEGTLRAEELIGGHYSTASVRHDRTQSSESAGGTFEKCAVKSRWSWVLNVFAEDFRNHQCDGERLAPVSRGSELHSWYWLDQALGIGREQTGKKDGLVIRTRFVRLLFCVGD